MTKVFFDTEFTGLHQNTSLISIALVSECRKIFYAEFNDYYKEQVDDWIKNNVLTKLIFPDKTHFLISDTNGIMMKSDTEDIVSILKLWLSQFEKIEIWSDCLSYDWMLFCQLFGGALNIPKNIYYIPFDICTSFKNKGIDPDINREEFINYQVEVNDHYNWGLKKHNALWDAYVIRECYKKLTKNNDFTKEQIINILDNVAKAYKERQKNKNG